MGRDYATVSPQFWSGKTGRQIRAMGKDAQLVALYLITCPGSTATGVYYLPLPTLEHETNCSVDEARHILKALEDVEFASYDEAEEMIWVRNMAREQIATTLKQTDKRWKWLVKEVETFRGSRFFLPWLENYSQAFSLGEAFKAPSKPLQSPSKAPAKHPRSPSEGDDKPAEGQPEAPPMPGTRARARAGTRAGTRAGAGAGAPAPCPAPAAAFGLGIPFWMDQELQGLGISEKHAADLLNRIGVEGIREALAKLRSKATQENPAGLLIRKAEELAQEGRGQLEKNLKRAVALSPGALEASGWPQMLPELRDDPEVAIAWCMYLRTGQDEARASEHAKEEFSAIRFKAEAIFLDLIQARHPDPGALAAEAERAAQHSPQNWKAQARRMAMLRMIGLDPLKPASGGN
jgi:hypothetical protein